MRNELSFEFGDKKCIIFLVDNKYSSTRTVRLGYVGVPKGHPLYKVHYGDKLSWLNNSLESMIMVHGGVSFSGFLRENGLRNFWFFGYDCNHSYDMEDPKSLSFCENECRQLSNEIDRVVKKMKRRKLMMSYLIKEGNKCQKEFF